MPMPISVAGMAPPSAVDRLKELTRPTGEEDLMRVTYPTPRLHIAPRTAAAAVGCVAAVCLAAVGWSSLRSPDSVTNAPEPLWSTAAEANELSDQVVVAVVGAVEQPGLVTLDQGSRVADALDKAQPLPNADLISVNLAQLLVDGQQIHVLAQGEAPAPGVAQQPGPQGPSDGAGISLNSATAAELTELPGVGEATAAAIVAHRESNGPFTALEQLMDVKGIGPAKFEAVKDLVTL